MISTENAVNSNNNKEFPLSDVSINNIVESANLDFKKKNALGYDKQNFGILKIKSANEWIEQSKSQPIPTSLWEHQLWFENETCILFADTNVGKSILAVQIAVEIAKKQRVLYFDFELSAKQFELRYSDNYTNHFKFPENFLRAEIDVDLITESNNLEEAINKSIEQAIVEHDCKILVVDNITFLKNETDKAKNALPLMKALKLLQKKYMLSLLALAHTPKRNLSNPITANDLQGSKMLMNFCDSAFAIGQSSEDPSLKYIKQIKERNTSKILHENHVAIYRIQKDINFLFMLFEEFGTEREHLQEKIRLTKEEKNNRILDFHKQGLTQRQIAARLDIGLGTVNSYINKHLEKLSAQPNT